MHQHIANAVLRGGKWSLVDDCSVLGAMLFNNYDFDKCQIENRKWWIYNSNESETKHTEHFILGMMTVVNWFLFRLDLFGG